MINEDTNLKNIEMRLNNVLIYAAMWGIGATLDE
jgi:hypothetical protein